MRRDVVATIPAYRCAATIRRVVDGCRRYLETVVVIDDGSDDNTAFEARAAGARVESLPRNLGKGMALQRGITLALAENPDAVVLLDGDGQHAPSDLPNLLAAWDSGACDLVVGSRLHTPSLIPRARLFTNYIGSKILSRMTGFELEDSQSGYRLLSAPLLRRLGLSAKGYAIESEMLLKAAKLGARLAHVPVTTIYEGAPSHFQPVRDTFRIACASVYYKVFDES